MAIRVFGAPPNRTHRVLWMLAEGGLEYELVRLHSVEEIAASEELGHLNPNRRVPTLVDGEVTVWDSLAINLYLCDRYELLRPEGPGGFAHAIQWSLFAQTELDGDLMALAKASLAPEGERDTEGERRLREALARPLSILDRLLGDREHLVGSEFSVADLNVAAVLVMAFQIGLDLGAHSHLRPWLRRCLDRPAAAEVFSRALEG